MKGLPRSLDRGIWGSAPAEKATISLYGKTFHVAAAGAGIGFGSIHLEGLPKGNILIQGVGGTVGFDGNDTGKISATWEGDFSLGSEATEDTTLSGTNVDILTSTAIGPATLELVEPARHVEAGQGFLDNTDGTRGIYLNMLIDAADIIDASSEKITLDGWIEVSYIRIG